MADMPRLTAPRLRIVMDDGSEHIVQAINVDLILWDRTRVRHGWPKVDEAPFVWMTFIGWAALKREGATTLDHAAFEKACLECSVLTDEAVDPTSSAAEQG